jgi:hypothetical protein
MRKILMSSKHPMVYEEIELPTENNKNEITMKVGDKVKIREDLEVGKWYGNNSINSDMPKYFGKIGKIKEEAPFGYGFEIEGCGVYNWTEEMLIPLSQVEDQDKGYPREMYVWDDWTLGKSKQTVLGHLEGEEYPYITKSEDEDKFVGYRYAEDVLEKSEMVKWEDLREIDGYFIREDSMIGQLEGYSAEQYNRNIFPTREDAESSLALAQLLQIRRAMIGDWEPDWDDMNQDKFCIVRLGNMLYIEQYNASYRELSFPEEQMARGFLENNEELVNRYFKL